MLFVCCMEVIKINLIKHNHKYNKVKTLLLTILSVTVVTMETRNCLSLKSFQYGLTTVRDWNGRANREQTELGDTQIQALIQIFHVWGGGRTSVSLVYSTWCSPWWCWGDALWWGQCSPQTESGWWTGSGCPSPCLQLPWPHPEQGSWSSSAKLWLGTAAAADPRWRKSRPFQRQEALLQRFIQRLVYALLPHN